MMKSTLRRKLLRKVFNNRAMLKIRPIQPVEFPCLKDIAPPEWNTDLSVTFSFHYGYSYYYPIIAELDGRIVGCAQGLLTGASGWLGNIVVRPECRGHGIGKKLTSNLIEFFRAKGCHSQILTATTLGEPIYRKLGFVEISRYIFLRRAEPLTPKPIPNVRRAREKDLPAILALDREATGEERAPFLCRFFGDAWVYSESQDAEIEGFYLPELRDGPIIASTARAWRALLQSKLGRGKTFLVVPKENAASLKFLKKVGFEETGSAPRMVLGEEVNWKPQWVFSRGAGYCG